MVIHVVNAGETTTSIAQLYGVSAARLIQDNGIDVSGDLVPGEAIVILNPVQTYIVKEGDTLSEIANENGITMNQLLRNNPYLADRGYIYPGEELVISYGNKTSKIEVNGYANSFIEENVLQRTLPFLTYLSVFGNRNSYGGEVITVEDTETITFAKDYNVIPIMMLSTMSSQGRGSLEISYSIVNDEKVLENNIGNIIEILQRKGYYGVNITFQFINSENSRSYERFINRIVERLKQEGFLVFITISENFIIEVDRVTFEKIDFLNMGKIVDGVTVLNYNWGSSYGPPGPVASVFLMEKFIDYINTMIPSEKMEIGIPIIGYDWELPYIIGVTKANSLTLNSVIALARETNSVILFDEVSQNPYFRYMDNRSGVPISHIVWFVDARSINAILNIVTEKGFRGVGIWNIMNYYAPLWSTVNSQYNIATLI
jgi:spore germination protein